MDTDKPSDEEIMKRFGYEDALASGKINWWQKLKPKLWLTFDRPFTQTPGGRLTPDQVDL